MRFFSFLIVLSVFYSCSKSGKKYSNEFSGKINIEDISIDPKTPPGVGALVVNYSTPWIVKQSLPKDSVYQNYSSFCSFSAVAKNKIITNAHCISNVEVKEGLPPLATSCEKGISGLLMTPKGVKKISCKNVEFYSFTSENINTKVQDYAVIEIKEELSEQSFLNISREGFKKGSLYDIHTMNFDFKEKSVDYIKKTCRSIEGEAYKSESLLSSYSLRVKFSTTDEKEDNCNVIPGNSGSIITTSGEMSARGVISHSIDHIKEEYLELLKESHPRAKFPKKIYSFASGENFSCSELGDFAPKINGDQCEGRYERDLFGHMMKINDELGHQLHVLAADHFLGVRKETSFNYDLSLTEETIESEDDYGNRTKSYIYTVNGRQRCLQSFENFDTSGFEIYSFDYDFILNFDSYLRPFFVANSLFEAPSVSQEYFVEERENELIAVYKESEKEKKLRECLEDFNYNTADFSNFSEIKRKQTADRVKRVSELLKTKKYFGQEIKKNNMGLEYFSKNLLLLK